MKKRLGVILCLILLPTVPVRAENYTVRGGMDAVIVRSHKHFNEYLAASSIGGKGYRMQTPC